ncbi:MAG: parallel beta-helix repeat protein [Myxococcota bacterium]|jgi:parallel beta-helix repeat protein
MKRQWVIVMLSLGCAACGADEEAPAATAPCGTAQFGNVSTGCFDLTDCVPGQYVSQPNTATSDRVCDACDPGDSFSADTNASACAPVTACGAGELLAAAATLTADTLCALCPSGTWAGEGDASCRVWSDCLPGESVASAGTATADRTCTACTAGVDHSTTSNADTCMPVGVCHAGQSVLAAATASSDVTCLACPGGTFSAIEDAAECAPWTSCTPGEHVADAGSDTGDRQCVPCDMGVTWSAESNTPTCLPVTSCIPGEFVAVQATASADAVCGACPAGAYSTGADSETCAPWTVCGPGAYLAVSGTATHDAQCAACSLGETWSMGSAADGCLSVTECAPAEYVVSEPTLQSDRSCAPCGVGTFSTLPNSPSCTAWTECVPGQFVVAGGGSSADQQCGACDAGIGFSTAANSPSCAPVTACAPGQYMLAAATASSDVSCLACPDGTFSAIEDAVECVPWTSCTPGERVALAGSDTTDRQCASCVAGVTWSAEANAPACAPVTPCAPSEVVSIEATASADAVCGACPVGSFSTEADSETCAPWTVCGAGTYLALSGTATQDAECPSCTLGETWSTGTDADGCLPVTECAPGEYVVSEPTLQSDRSCAPCGLGTFSTLPNSQSCAVVTPCQPGLFVVAAATSSSDTICDACPESTFAATANAAVCTPWSTCPPGALVVAAATAIADVVCAACPSGTFSSATNATGCATWAVCPPGSWIAAAGTASSDAGCEACESGVTFSNADNSVQCWPVTPCATDHYEAAPPTQTADRMCAPLTVGVTVPSPIAYEGGAVPGVFQVALVAPQPVDVAVTFTLSGTAATGTDFTLSVGGSPVAGMVTIKAGAVSASIHVQPTVSAVVEASEWVALQLQPTAHYTLLDGANTGVVRVVEHGPSAGVVYVVAEDGDDANTGDESSPFATVAHAVAQLSTGDTLLIKDGTYTNPGFTDDHGATGELQLDNPVLARVQASGTADNWIRIAAWPDDNGIRPLLKFDGAGGIEFAGGIHHVLVEGLEIEGPNASITHDQALAHRWSKENYYKGRGVFTWGPVDHVVVRDCDVHHSPGSGVRFNKADYILVEGNTVSNTTWWSSSAESGIVIAIAQSVDAVEEVKILYSGNVVYNNWNTLEFCALDKLGSTEDEYGNCDDYTGGIIDGQGLYVTRNNDTYLSGRMRFENNIAFNNGFGGVVYHKTNRGELVNNVVFMNGAWPGVSDYSGLTVNTVDDLLIANNIVWGRDDDDYGIKDNGNATNIVATHNYVVGKTQFGSAADNIFLLPADAPSPSALFANGADISGASPLPSAPDGPQSPSEIDQTVQAFQLDLRPAADATALMDSALATVAPPSDFDGVIRPQGGGVDIGAFELSNSDGLSCDPLLDPNCVVDYPAFAEPQSDKPTPAALIAGEPLPVPTGEPVSIAVVPDQVLRTFGRQLQGNNAAVWLGKSYLLAPTAAERIADAGVGLLRWPGGSTSDKYFWNGVVPPYAEAQGWGNTSGSWAPDTADFLTLAQQVDAEPVLVVNHGYAQYDTTVDDGTLGTAVALAADWVEYCNSPNDGSNPGGGVDWAAQRASDGHEEPFGVRHWEVGNEVYGSWTVGYDPTGVLYAQRFNAFADAMKDVDPTIKIGIVGHVDPGETNGAAATWMAAVLTHPGTAERIDFIDIHEYFHHVPSNGPLTGPQLLALADQVEADIVALDDLVAANTPVSSLPVLLGEYNMTNPQNPHNVQLASALFTGRVLGEVIRTGYAAAAQWDVANSWKDGGDHGFMSRNHPTLPDYTPWPSYYAFWFWGRNMGDRLVPATSDTPTVRVYATRFASGATGLILINEGPDDRAASIAGVAAGGAINTWTLSGPDLTDTVFDVNGAASGFDVGGPAPDVIPARVAQGDGSAPTLQLPGYSLTSVLLY